MVGKSDPYAVIRYGTQETKPPVGRNSQNPEWSNETDFKIPDGGNLNFSVKVFDSDLEKGLRKLQRGTEALLKDAVAIGADGQPGADTVNSLGDRLGNLRDSLEGKAGDLKGAGAAAGDLHDTARDLGDAMLDDKVQKSVGIREEKNLGSITGDTETIKSQQEDSNNSRSGFQCSKQRC